MVLSYTELAVVLLGAFVLGILTPFIALRVWVAIPPAKPHRKQRKPRSLNAEPPRGDWRGEAVSVEIA